MGRSAKIRHRRRRRERKHERLDYLFARSAIWQKFGHLRSTQMAPARKRKVQKELDLALEGVRRRFPKVDIQATATRNGVVISTGNP